ncbi:MAG: hypothetical protein RLZZ165_1865 [Bacteroidota bacterium]
MRSISGTLTCYGHLLVTGTLPKVGLAGGMTAMLYSLADASKVRMEHVWSRTARKGVLGGGFLGEAGSPSWTGACSYGNGVLPDLPAWGAVPPAGRSWLRRLANDSITTSPADGGDLGLCHVRVPTWAPFRLRLCINGHNWLERQMDKAGIGYRMPGNAFLQVDDWEATRHWPTACPKARLPGCWTRMLRRSAPLRTTSARPTTVAYSRPGLDRHRV